MPFPEAEAFASFPKLVQFDGDRDLRGGKFFALYTLVPLDDSEALLAAVSVNKNWPQELNDDQIKLAPEYDFSGKTLGDLVTYHGELSKSHAAEYDPSHFIVAIHEDYTAHGVLIVELIHQYFTDTEAVPMLVRCPLESDAPEHFGVTSPLCFWNNLQIGEMNLTEMREQEEVFPWPLTIPGYEDLKRELQACLEQQKQRIQALYDTTPDRPERYSIHIAVDTNLESSGYWDSARTQKSYIMPDDIEPKRYYKYDADRASKVATTGGEFPRYGLTQEQMMDLIRQRHPGCCSVQKGGDSGCLEEPTWHVHKTWMFIYDRATAIGEGYALVKAHWDGLTEGKSKDELEAIMPVLEVVERCQPQEALRRMDEISGVARAIPLR